MLKQSWRRFTATARIVRGMRAKENGIDVATHNVQMLIHFPVNRIQGLYILTVCTPVDEGSGLALDYVDSLLDRFNGSSDVAGVAITVSIEYSEAQSAFVDEPFYCVPIEIAWYAYE